MSEKQFEECSLSEASHVEVGGKVYEFGDGIVEKFKNGGFPTLRFRNEIGFYELINESSFTTFNIQPLREKKQEPIVFEATFVKNDGQWHTLAILNDSFAYLNNKRVRFRCVEILEEE